MALASAAGMSSRTRRTPPGASGAGIDARLAEAVRLHQAGRLADAEAGYRAVLRHQPRHPDALHLLGLAAYHRGDSATAVDLIRQALERRPRFAAAETNLGNALLALGRAAEACEAHRRALALEPGDPMVLHNLGNACLHLGDLAGAEQAFRAALERLPGHPLIRLGLARVLAAAGRAGPAEAELRQAIAAAPELAEARDLLGELCLARGDHSGAQAEFAAALALAPRDFRANTGLGVVLLRVGRAAEALPFLQTAREVSPTSPLALSNLGAALRATGRLVEALAVLEEAVARDPTHADARCNLGAVLTDLGRAAEALPHFARAAEEAPANPTPHVNIGSALADLGRYEEAADAARAALARDPRHAAALTVLGRALGELGRHAEAIAACERALEIDPDWVEARWNLALPLLRTGEYERGWRAFESRFEAVGRKLRPAPLPVPRWGGEDPAGRTILAYWEQGFGDTIHFARYLPLLAARGARVLFDCQAPLRPLFRDFPGVAALVDPARERVEAEFQVALMSLPHLFGTTLETVPAAVPYLRAPGCPEELVLPDTGRFRVGVAWAGSPGQANNRFRSIPLADLAPLFGLPDIDWYGLQVGEEAAELRRIPEAATVVDLSPRLRDFADTAAVMEQLDLVLTVDTSVAHLAGALARPVWILLAHVCCWRYLLEREDSPWYPTARLFRQERPGDWPGVVSRLARELPRLTSHGARSGARRHPRSAP